MVTEKQQESAKEKKMRRHLDEQAKNLDAETLSRLRQARARALEYAENPAVWTRPGIWVGGLATAGVCAIALFLSLPKPAGMESDVVPLTADTDILVDQQSIQFYDELDFYIWLEHEGLGAGEV